MTTVMRIAAFLALPTTPVVITCQVALRLGISMADILAAIDIAANQARRN